MADSETAGRTTIETPDLVKGLFDPLNFDTNLTII